MPNSYPEKLNQNEYISKDKLDYKKLHNNPVNQEIGILGQALLLKTIKIGGQSYVKTKP